MEQENKVTDNLSVAGLIARLKLKTPPFFKKLRRVFHACTVIGTAISALSEEQAEWLSNYLPEHVGAALVTIGLLGAAVCSITVDDSAV